MGGNKNGIRNSPTKWESDCPDNQVLAAFVDGKIFGKDRERLLSHLRQCKDCYDVLADAVDIRQDLSDDVLNMEAPDFSERRDKILSLFGIIPVSGKTVKAMGKVFAYSIPAAAAAFYFSFYYSEPTWSSHEIIGNLVLGRDVRVVSDAISIVQSNRLSLGFSREVSNEKILFQAGATLVQLEIAVRAGDVSKIEYLTIKLADRLRGYSDKEAADERLDDLLIRLSDTSVLDRVGQTGREVESWLLDTPFDFYLKFGMVIEIGKMAARLKDPIFFKEDYFKYFIKHKKSKSLPPGVIRKLKTIDEISGKKSVAKNYETLYTLLHQIEITLL
ncbi:MAG: zf-HC2 domain-containing protein [Proteobacteria bacterium]|nr:zf-HC2 domain-containing protein [Pseudomonadota bacterium]